MNNVRLLGYARLFFFTVIVALTAVSFGTAPGLAQKSKKSAAAQSSDKAGSPLNGTRSPWLIKWKGGEVPLTDFEAAYLRMNGKPAYSTTLDSLKDFLGVYSDYRLKLQQAHEERLDRDPKILKEIEGYRIMLEGPYVLDKEVTEPAMKLLYERRQYEVHAAHFLAAVKNWNSPADTQKAYSRRTGKARTTVRPARLVAISGSSLAV